MCGVGTGNVQVYLDSTTKRTTGSITHHDAPLTGEFTTTGSVDPNFNVTGRLDFQVRGPRVISIESTLQPGSSAEPYTISWNQSIQYSNTNNLSSTSASTTQTASGHSTSMHDNAIFYSHEFSYPFSTSNHGTLYTVNHEYDQTTEFGLPLVFKEPSSQHVNMQQSGEATMVFDSQGRLTGGNGTTKTDYLYNDSDHFSFTRFSSTDKGTVTSDIVEGNLKAKAARAYP
jgi:hypothetical protein